MNDKDGYEEIAEEADKNYMKENNDNELKLIKSFITKINNGMPMYNLLEYSKNYRKINYR